MNPVAIIADSFKYVNKNGNPSFAVRLLVTYPDGHTEQTSALFRDFYGNLYDEVRQIAKARFGASEETPLRSVAHSVPTWKLAKKLAEWL